MDVSNSIEAVNQVLQLAQQAQVDHAEKLLKVNAEIALSGPSAEGLGENLDLIA